MVENYLRVGKIVNTQGIKGEVRVIPLTDNMERFNNLEYVYMEDEGLTRMSIEHVRFHKNFVLLKFIGIDSINDGEKLKNTYILVDRDHTVRLPEGSFFVSDLIGMDVYDSVNEYLGKILYVIATGSNDVYVVKNGEKEVLIPALKTVVKNIDLQEGKMIVEIPEGLI